MLSILAAIIAGMVLIVMALVLKTQNETKKKRKMIEDKVASIAVGNGFQWSCTDTSLNRAIAWFAEKKLLLFIDFADNKERIRLINFNEIDHCTLQEKGIVEIGKNRNRYKHITLVELELHYKEKNKGTETLQFYNELYDGLTERISLTEKAKYWQTVMLQS